MDQLPLRQLILQLPLVISQREIGEGTRRKQLLRMLVKRLLPPQKKLLQLPRLTKLTRKANLEDQQLMTRQKKSVSQSKEDLSQKLVSLHRRIPPVVQLTELKEPKAIPRKMELLQRRKRRDKESPKRQKMELMLKIKMKRPKVVRNLSTESRELLMVKRVKQKKIRIRRRLRMSHQKISSTITQWNSKKRRSLRANGTNIVMASGEKDPVRLL